MTNQAALDAANAVLAMVQPQPVTTQGQAAQPSVSGTPSVPTALQGQGAPAAQPAQTPAHVPYERVKELSDRNGALAREVEELKARLAAQAPAPAAPVTGTPDIQAAVSAALARQREIAASVPNGTAAQMSAVESIMQGTGLRASEAALVARARNPELWTTQSAPAPVQVPGNPAPPVSQQDRDRQMLADPFAPPYLRRDAATRSFQGIAASLLSGFGAPQK